MWQCLITFAVGRLKKMGPTPGGTSRCSGWHEARTQYIGKVNARTAKGFEFTSNIQGVPTDSIYK